MPTKTVWLSEKSPQETINRKSKRIRCDAFVLEVNGPDDRRVDEALADDAKLDKALRQACAKAAKEFLVACTEAVEKAEKAADSGKGDPRQAAVAALRDAFSAFESSVGASTAKLWKAKVAEHPELRSARFDPVVRQWSPSVTVLADPGKAASGLEYDKVLEALHMLGKQSSSDLSAFLERYDRIREDVDDLNGTASTLAAAYGQSTRESQKDNPETGPDEEPDEQKLDQAIFLKHGQAIQAASDYSARFGAQLLDGAKQLKKLSAKVSALAGKLKGTEKRMQKVMRGGGAQKGDYSPSELCGELLTLLQEAETSLRGHSRAFQNYYGVMNALAEKKTGAFGLLDRVSLKAMPKPGALLAAIDLLETLGRM